MDRVREMEEKPQVAMNAVVNNYHIPDDLAFSILSKLPIKSLKRFGCVCTSWSLLFDNPLFMTMFRNNFTCTPLLLKQNLSDEEYHSPVYLLSGERFENKVSLDFPPQIQDDAISYHVLGVSANGILCLLHHSDKLVLWNPTTEEFTVIPPSPDEFESPYREPSSDLKGFGYDHIRDDYKVIRYMEFSELFEEELDRMGVPHDGPCDLKNISFEPLWEIYNLRSNSWRKLDCEMSTTFFYDTDGARLYKDGVCHWWGLRETLLVSCLVSFDLSNEVFFTTPLPSYMGDDGSFDFQLMRVHLAVINGSVAFISNYADKTTIEVSILGEIGVKKSWTKLFIIGSLPYVVTLIGAGGKGNVFFRKKDGELAWFDWSTNMIVNLGLKGEKWNSQIVTYKKNFESLTSIGFEK